MGEEEEKKPAPRKRWVSKVQMFAAVLLIAVVSTAWDCPLWVSVLAAAVVGAGWGYFGPED